MLKEFILFCGIAFLAACNQGGPQKALDETAKAMENNNPQAFLSNFDLKAYTANRITAMTENDKALNMLNSFGNALGLGSIDSLINSFLDIEADIREDFTLGISTGELMAECRSGDTPNCPWTPEALRSAQIIEVGQDGAIAKVTTKAQLTSWLAMRKIGDNWFIVGLAPLESQARVFASQATPPASQPPHLPKLKIPQLSKPEVKPSDPVHI